jgi:hypothetical protein
MAIDKGCLNQFAIASDLSSANQISKENMVQFLCEEIMSAVSKGHIQGNAKNGILIQLITHYVHSPDQ